MDPGVSFFIWLAATLLLSTVLFVRTLRRQFKRLGTLAYFSPAFGFYVVFVATFFVRPLLMNAGKMIGYNDTAAQFNLYQIVLPLAIVGATAFYLTFDPPALRDIFGRFLKPPKPVPAFDTGMLQRISLLLMGLSIVSTSVFFVLIYQMGAVTGDLGVNRAIFSSATAGQGHLFLINTIGAVSLLMAVYAKTYFTRPVQITTLVVVAWYLLPNLIVTNRFLVTAVLTGVALCALLRYKVLQRQVPARGVILFFVAVATFGSVLGMARGLGQYEFDESNSANPIVFFLWSLDMSELLSRTIEYNGPHDYGMIWLQDLLYLYVPRAVWAAKPQIYGAIQAQADVLPELIPKDGIPIATYPIGVFGEGYYVWGWIGVIIALAVTGLTLRKIFSSIVQLQRPYLGMLVMPVFILQCLNPLGYFRSLGWFMSLVIFHLIISLAALILAYIAANGGRTSLRKRGLRSSRATG